MGTIDGGGREEENERHKWVQRNSARDLAVKKVQ